MRPNLLPRPVLDAGVRTIPLPSPGDAGAPGFVQHVEVSSQLRGRTRLDVFRQLLVTKRVLHVGYADWPITDSRHHLHVQLDAVCAALDGIDANDDAAAVIGGLVKGRLFTRWGEITDAYDVVLAPEVLAHVADVEGFFSALDLVDARTIIMTVPDASQSAARRFGYDPGTQMFTEVVHPDQHAWYSPYTFYNVVTKHTDWHVAGLWLFDRQSLLMIADKRPRSAADRALDVA